MDDIYNCFWKFCLNCKMKIYHLKINVMMMKRLKFVYCQVRLNPLQMSKHSVNSLDTLSQ